jgi:Ca2+ transporting ATPase
MFKHIIAQSLLQLTIILIIVFDGENFLPEFKDDADETIFKGYLGYKYSDAKCDPPEDKEKCACPSDEYCTLMAPGRMVNADGSYAFEKFYKIKHEFSRHVEINS